MTFIIGINTKKNIVEMLSQINNGIVQESCMPYSNDKCYFVHQYGVGCHGYALASM